jgi:hypothetical protein
LRTQWPNRTVKVVVPYGVGGVTDTMARLTADRLGKAFNQTFVIENKLGAGGAIGVDYALNSPQDGYTILFLGSTLFTVLPLAQKVNYEPLKTLVPVSITGTKEWFWWSTKTRRTRHCASSLPMRGRTPARSPIRAAARPRTIICRRPISPEKKASTWFMCHSAAARPR